MTQRMPEQHDVHVLSVEQTVIDEACVAGLVASIRDTASETVASARTIVAIDLSKAREITPRALAALLELDGAGSATLSHLCLVGLSRKASLLAVQVGLAEHFDIFASRAALDSAFAPPKGRFDRSGSGGEHKRMCALIHEVEAHPGVGALDIAGRPLLLRQLQFLRDVGVEDVFVEVAEGPHALERAQVLLSSDPLTARVQVLPSARALGPAELARRAGFSENELFLSVPATLMLHAKLDLQVQAPTRYLLSAPLSTHASSTAVDLSSRLPSASEATTMEADGWGFHVQHPDHAHTLACAALEGHAPGIIVHGAEIKPGIWYARGARVSSDAQLTGPVLIGPDCRVFAGAKIGPRTVLGQAVIVEREAAVTESSVAPHTIVGEAARIRGVHADAQGIVNFRDGSRSSVSDNLVLATRTQVGTALASRMFALLLLVLLATPWLIGLAIQKALKRPAVRSLETRRGHLHIGESGFGVVDLLPALFDVVMGRRDLVGINDRRALEVASRQPGEPWRAGAIDLSPAMAPGASTQTLLRMWRWYRAHKNAALDRSLWREGVFKPLRKAQ